MAPRRPRKAKSRASHRPRNTTVSDIRLAIESVLFVAHGPVDIATLARVAGVSAADVESELETIAADYRGRGLRVQRTGDAAQFVSAPEAASFVQAFLGVDENQSITPAALETLAIIAYKQPISRSAIERIRGVNCDYAVAALKARSLITEVGRAAGPGRPYLYGTTFRFLEHFGLERPEDLPPLPELDGALAGLDEPEIAQVIASPTGDLDGDSADVDATGEEATVHEDEQGRDGVEGADGSVDGPTGESVEPEQSEDDPPW